MKRDEFLTLTTAGLGALLWPGVALADDANQNVTAKLVEIPAPFPPDDLYDYAFVVRYEVMGGKTGFILEAGYCFATWIRTQGRDLIAVVLGAPTNATRFADTVRLLQKSTAPAAASSGT